MRYRNCPLSVNSLMIPYITKYMPFSVCISGDISMSDTQQACTVISPGESYHCIHARTQNLWSVLYVVKRQIPPSPVCLQAYIFSFHLQLIWPKQKMTYFEYIKTVFTKIRLLWIGSKMCAVYRDVKTESILIARLGHVNTSKMTSAVVICCML